MLQDLGQALAHVVILPTPQGHGVAPIVVSASVWPSNLMFASQCRVLFRAAV